MNKPHLYHMSMDGYQAAVIAFDLNGAWAVLRIKTGLDWESARLRKCYVLDMDVYAGKTHDIEVLACEAPITFTRDIQPVPVEPDWVWEETRAVSERREDGKFFVVLARDDAVDWPEGADIRVCQLIKLNCALYKIDTIEFDDDKYLGLIVTRMLDKPSAPSLDNDLPQIDYSWDKAVDWQHSKDQISVLVDSSLENGGNEDVYPGSGHTIEIDGTLYTVLTASFLGTYILLEVFPNN